MKLTYKHTITACFIGYIVQAIINNFVPLLFLTFEKDYGIPLSRIGILVGINFGIQLLTDLVAALAIEKTGWRIPMVLAHILSVCGLVLLAVLPGVMDNKFLALIIAVSFAAVGGGLLEVLISPITEACPGDDKAGAMSLLHSFYCWGYMGVVILSTLFFAFFGIDNWQTLAVIWAIVPLINLVLFCFVPFGTLSADNDEKQTVGKLFKNKTFLLMIVIMFCAACCEQSVSQWASAFAEKALGVRKSIGDLAGPMLFALFMGSARAVHGSLGNKIKISLEKLILFSSILCLGSYFVISLCPLPWISLIGCGICGFSVGILWPGTFSIAAKTVRGGTFMFAILALFGDLGCGAGPLVVGTVASALGDNLNMGILVSAIFPVIMIFGLIIHIKSKKSA